MTDTERASADNLIFLCGDHHDAIDSQLNLHTVEFLRSAKATHEARCDRSVRYELGQLGFKELVVVCSVLGEMDDPLTPIDVPLSIDDKIDLNNLGPTSADQITDGLAQAGRVGEFVEFQSRLSRGFGTRLASHFKKLYYGALATELTPDEIFDDIVARAQENSGPADAPKHRAAALAVVAFFFERCEIFEHDATAS